MLLWASLAVVMVSKAKIWHGGILPIPVLDEFLGLWAMYLLIVVSQSEKGALYRILGYKPLVFLGTFAYSIYLVHAPLLQVFWQYIFVPLQNRPSQMFVALALVATPLIVGMSYASFLLCERPFLKRKAKAAVPLAVTTALEPAP